MVGHKLLLFFFFFRPYVLTIQWLLDSFSKGALQPEEVYPHSSYKPAEIQDPAQQQVLVPSLRKASSTNANVRKSTNPTRTYQADEDLLSQYAENDSTFGKMYRILF